MEKRVHIGGQVGKEEKGSKFIPLLFFYFDQKPELKALKKKGDFANAE